MPCPNRAHAVLCRGLEKSLSERQGWSTEWARHGHGMANVNLTLPHCVNQMGKTQSKRLAARHVKGTVWTRHAMCELAFTMFTAGHHLSLPWTTLILSTPFHPVLRGSLILSPYLRLCVPVSFCSSGLPSNILYEFLSPVCVSRDFIQSC
jgi:hypothetical protein